MRIHWKAFYRSYGSYGSYMTYKSYKFQPSIPVRAGILSFLFTIYESLSPQYFPYPVPQGDRLLDVLAVRRNSDGHLILFEDRR